MQFWDKNMQECIKFKQFLDCEMKEIIVKKVEIRFRFFSLIIFKPAA